MKRVWLSAGVMAAILAAGTTRADSYADAFAAAEAGNYARAVELMTPLAEQGNAQAQFNLALMYHGGLGVNRSETAAVEWYQRAASAGSKEAQEFLAVGFQEGWFGLPKDAKQAHYWLDRLKKS